MSRSSHRRYRLLLLLPFAPRLDATHGGARVLAQQLMALAPRHEIAVIYVRAADELAMDRSLHAQCALVEEVIRPAPPQHPLVQRLRHTATLAQLLCGQPLWCQEWDVPTVHKRVRSLVQQWQPEMIQIEFQIMAQYLGAMEDFPAPRVLVAYDPGAAAARDGQRATQAPPSLTHRLDVWAWQRFERAIMRRVQAVVVFTERDRQTLAPVVGNTPIFTIPFGTLLPERALDPLGSLPPSIVFVGNFVHPPNVDAAERLATSIVPLLRTHDPKLKLYLVGDRPPARIQQLANEQIVVTGHVPDVVPYLDRASVVVIPLRYGGGMRVKLLEALAAGKAVVASSLAAEGLNLTHREQIWFAERDPEFSHAIAELLADDSQRVALATRARAWACANLGWNRSVMLYEQLYRQLIEQPR